MQKIMPNEENEKAEGRKRRIIVIVVSAIMLLSTLGYSFMGFGKGPKTKENYKGIDFELMEDGWHFGIQGINFVTMYLPSETENISADILISAQDYAGKPLYFSPDSLYEGVREIEKNLYFIAERMQYACLDYNCSSYAVKNCTTDSVILIKPGNETIISQDENCILITASQSEVVRASDKLLFKILGLA